MFQSNTSQTDATCDLPGGALAVPPRDFPDPDLDLEAADGEQTAVLAGGCFWCVEAVLKELDGVVQVVSGYAGGSEATADYRSVCSGSTDHAEVVAVTFDPQRISYGQLLKVFLSVAHDPTQRNRQGNDRGPQYRSAIFFADSDQQRVAEAYVDQLERAGVYRQPIVTTLEPLDAFYPAEEHHQDYAARNPNQPYIRAISDPKVEKLRQQFGDRLRTD